MLTVKVLPAEQSYSDIVLQQVEQLWQQAVQASDKKLFDSTIFSFSALREQQVWVQPVAYKFFYAQYQQTKLRETLKLRPLGVAAVLCCVDGAVLAQRSPWVMQAPNQWEFAPSGGISAEFLSADNVLDYRSQLMAELEEELGLSADDISRQEVLGMFFDQAERVVDIIVGLHSQLTAEQVQQKFAERQNDEYQALSVIPVADLPTWLANHAHATWMTSLLIQDFAAELCY
jgi:8-oxo-dGTP pyrophosphatase MutT (NUDIX family)